MRVLKGIQIPITSNEIIKYPNPNMKNRKIPNIDVFNNPNILFHSQIPVPRSPIHFPAIKRQIPVPNLPLHDPQS